MTVPHEKGGAAEEEGGGVSGTKGVWGGEVSSAGTPAGQARGCSSLGTAAKQPETAKPGPVRQTGPKRSAWSEPSAGGAIGAFLRGVSQKLGKKRGERWPESCCVDATPKLA